MAERGLRIPFAESLFSLVGGRLSRGLEILGGISRLSGKAMLCLVSQGLDWRELFRQFLFIGNRSLSIVLLTAFSTGLVIALQLLVGLGRFGLKLYVGQLVGLSVFRELGPVLTSLMVAARVGSGIAAELGSMAVTEQVLAIEAMGASPVQKLVVPRLVACVIGTPLLVVMANIAGIMGGMIMAVRDAGVTPRFYIDQVQNILILEDFTSGMIKSACFGLFIAVIACYQGLTAQGGTEGVGKATTRAVVYSSIVILVSDFFLTKLILYF